MDKLEVILSLTYDKLLLERHVRELERKLFRLEHLPSRINTVLPVSEGSREVIPISKLVIHG